MEGLTSAETAAGFGYTPGSLRVLVHQFRRHPTRDFFVPTARRVCHRASESDFGDGSSRCANRISPSTTSAVGWPAMANHLARRASPRSSRKRASPDCRGAAPQNAAPHPNRKVRCGIDRRGQPISAFCERFLPAPGMRAKPWSRPSLRESRRAQSNQGFLETSAPALASQILTVRSALAEASRVPSGENATLATMLVWPRRT